MTIQVRRRDQLLARTAGAAALLSLVIALGLLLAFEDTRWGAVALAIGSGLAAAFALLRMRATNAEAQSQVEEVEGAPAPAPRPAPHPAGDLPVHPATGFYLAWIFRRRLAEETARAGRYGHDLAVLVLEPADRLGEPDSEIYGRAAKALRRALRAGDFAGHFDDERFAVLLPEADKADAQRAGRRLLATLRASNEGSLRWRGALICYPEDASDAESLLDKAIITLRRSRAETEIPEKPPPPDGESEQRGGETPGARPDGQAPDVRQ